MKEGKLVCLGIESTAHTLGIGVVDSSGRVLANELATYRPTDSGIHPREAAQHHAHAAPEVLRRALVKSVSSADEIDVVAFASGPGLGPCLRTGATLARAIALKLGRPLASVNHGVAHIEIGKLATGFRDPVVLYVAGGNTLVTTFSEGRYRILGETLDIAAGNCLDAFGIEAGIGPMPAPEIWAAKGQKYIPMPMRVKGMDVSFSGALTRASTLLREGARVEDVALSLTEAVYSMLTEVLERAVAMTGKKEVMVVGGLARSRRLTEMVRDMVKLHGAEHRGIPDELLGDNGAMIAWTGLLMFRAGQVVSVEESHVRPRYRIDEVEVTWLGPSRS
ncbi:MAG: KEOPS complex N(6)-L-threonylcarbamoyladenine synthase Kae1 [Thaumarchaeota archaeon]|nr:KEOPS complex N(6)-L-threonylcarbamoyladenine synthase Kae1 [Candidatus Calditenuaceae archaeon]MDW8042067.1 KEOPS complex N(6)-L-threonylcarbamoyladenine synthase Kae1 [Nitrososphaerota archaeon]